MVPVSFLWEIKCENFPPVIEVMWERGYEEGQTAYRSQVRPPAWGQQAAEHHLKRGGGSYQLFYQDKDPWFRSKYLLRILKSLTVKALLSLDTEILNCLLKWTNASWRGNEDKSRIKGAKRSKYNKYQE